MTKASSSFAKSPPISAVRSRPEEVPPIFARAVPRKGFAPVLTFNEILAQLRRLRKSAEQVQVSVAPHPKCRIPACVKTGYKDNCIANNPVEQPIRKPTNKGPVCLTNDYGVRLRPPGPVLRSRRLQRETLHRGLSAPFRTLV